MGELECVSVKRAFPVSKSWSKDGEALDGHQAVVSVDMQEADLFFFTSFLLL